MYLNIWLYISFDWQGLPGRNEKKKEVVTSSFFLQMPQSLCIRKSLDTVLKDDIVQQKDGIGGFGNLRV